MGCFPRRDSARVAVTCRRLREVAAGRASEESGLDLVQERAALARSQREAQELKNAVARGNNAPVGLLTAVLGRAANVRGRSPGAPRWRPGEGCPALPDDARAVITRVIASANEWLRATHRTVVEACSPRRRPGRCAR